MGTRTATLTCVCAALAALLVAPHALARPTGSGRPAGYIDDAEDCIEAVPAATSVYGVEDDGAEVVLDVHVVLDDLHLEWGQRMVEFAAEPFADVGVRVDPTFEEVHFEASGELADGTPTIDPIALIEKTRAHTGGIRPYGADVVYTFTSKELVSSGAFGSSVAGQADCIGGVRYAHRAFAVGETGLEDRDDWSKYGGKIAAHEVAHLLGAHHHYANCAEGDPEGIRQDLTPCTLMFNDVFFISLRLSTIEAAAVRGHALGYANDTPTGPLPVAERAVWLSRSRKLLEGTVTSSAGGCVDAVQVVVAQRRGKTWETLEEVTTDEWGEFAVPIDAPGRLRATAPSTRGHAEGSWWECPEARSTI
jgi:hypothetical protein